MLGIVKLADTRPDAHRNNKFAFLIAVATGERIYFHQSDFNGDFSTLRAGQAVAFDGPKEYRCNRTGTLRRKAVGVRIVNPDEVLEALRPVKVGKSIPSAVWPPQHARAYQELSDSFGQHLISK